MEARADPGFEGPASYQFLRPSLEKKNIIMNKNLGTSVNVYLE
jgi:hypothetical protein